MARCGLGITGEGSNSGWVTTPHRPYASASPIASGPQSRSKRPTTRARAALAATRSLAGLKLAEAWPFHRSRSLTSRVCLVSAEKNRFFDVVCPTNLA